MTSVDDDQRDEELAAEPADSAGPAEQGDPADPADSDEHVAPAGRGRATIVLTAVIAVLVVVIAVAGGYLWGSHTGSSTATTPGAGSVDAGFARDMATHHQQAVTMAGYARDNSDDPAIKTVAFDIESSQSVQLGEMRGWLQQWNVSPNTDHPMTWMAGHDHVGADGLMPGMATPAQMAKLQTLHGQALDIMFLQLMIRHHQGGIAMAQYAALHATQSYVRTLAQTMYTDQSYEIVQMEQKLRQLGGTALPPPAD